MKIIVEIFGSLLLKHYLCIVKLKTEKMEMILREYGNHVVREGDVIYNRFNNYIAVYRYDNERDFHYISERLYVKNGKFEVLGFKLPITPYDFMPSNKEYEDMLYKAFKENGIEIINK